jgi:hypothetical protein
MSFFLILNGCTKDEIDNVVYIFVIKFKIVPEVKQVAPETHIHRIMNIVNNAFGNKIQLCE